MYTDADVHKLMDEKKELIDLVSGVKKISDNMECSCELMFDNTVLCDRCEILKLIREYENS